jgi:hypothetical protein
MHELERALRHPRAVWVVFGSLAALWLVMFALQVANYVTTVAGKMEALTQPDEFESSE